MRFDFLIFFSSRYVIASVLQNGGYIAVSVYPFWRRERESNLRYSGCWNLLYFYNISARNGIVLIRSPVFYLLFLKKRSLDASLISLTELLLCGTRDPAT
jgi:hypothetical protein